MIRWRRLIRDHEKRIDVSHHDLRHDGRQSPTTKHSPLIFQRRLKSKRNQQLDFTSTC
ncbi:hypothetical protein NOVOSPHI9U_130003 [Novosphingobium sp. 9U]|nr:hypothetical protein NOVOSPHI9U_130003 [Novosphingobium sp. 9U]